MAVEVKRLETGWEPDTPVADTVLRQFLHNEAALKEVVAGAAGGRSRRADGAFLADAGSPVPFYNGAILARPLDGPDDEVLDEVDSFFAATSAGVTLLSAWPTPDLRTRGWDLLGHPAFVLRGPGPVAFEPPPDVAVVEVTTAEGLATAERVAVEGYPLDEARHHPPGSVFPPALLGSPLAARLGLLAGEPVAAALSFVASGVVNLCLGATLPAARRRGVWESLVWARVADGPELPAGAYTSDFSRPGFVRMGFVPVTRFTLWGRSPAAAPSSPVAQEALGSSSSMRLPKGSST